MTRLKAWGAVVTCGLFVLGLTMPVMAAPPTFVFSISSIDDILDDADYLGESVGTPGLKETAEQLLKGFTGGAGLNGVDREKPLGMYWSISEKGEVDPGLATVFLPVSDADALKKLLGHFVPDLKVKDELWELSVAGQKAFGRIVDGYFYLSLSSSTVKEVASPDDIVNKDYDVALEINIASIPRQLKQTFLETTEREGRRGMENGPKPKSDAEAAGQKLGFEGMLAVITAITNDGDKLTFGFAVEEDDPLVVIDLGLTGKSNSGLAKTLSAYSKMKPAFSAVGEAAPFRMALSLPTAGLNDQFDQFLTAVRSSADDSINNDPTLKDAADKSAAKAVSKKVIDIMQSTIKSGSLSSILVIEAGSDDTTRMVGGTKVAKGDDAAKLMDDILKLAKESPEYAKVKTDVDKHAGARIHSIEGGFDDKQSALFGDSPAHLAFRADSLWFSLGGGNLDALKTSLEASGQNSTKNTAPISIRTKPATLVTLMEQNDERLVQRAEALAGEAGDVLNIEIIPTEKGGIKLHIEFGVELFKLGMDH